MKKIIMVFLTLCLFVVPALAFERFDESDAYHDYLQANELIQSSGLALNADNYWCDSDTGYIFDNAAFKADYASALAAAQKTEEDVETSYDVSNSPVSNQFANDVSSDDKYPVGSYIDEMGQVYSPEGKLLSTGSETISYLDAIGSLLDEVSDLSDEALDPDEESAPHVYNVVDLRSDISAVDTASDSITLADLKSLIVSIFGDYSPVMTTSTVTETVDGITTTTLIETVAEGAAGVDYAWIAGVFLFGILLFCLMKLLGGILK